MRARDPSLDNDRAGSVAWARSLVESGGFCVLDPETTGLKSPVQFVEIAIVDAGARTLFEGTFKPGCRIDPMATRVHGHTARSLAGSPPFREFYPDLLEVLWGRRMIVYNAPYDRRVWDAEVRSLGARGTLAGLLPAWECAMRRYATYVGEPSKRETATAPRSSLGGPQRPGRRPGGTAADRGDGCGMRGDAVQVREAGGARTYGVPTGTHTRPEPPQFSHSSPL
ncbi:MAG: 3'-5' exonuclease [Actinomycetota bacterium]|nr:3'-5' exonuclease [Actinomycetota bacterium]